MKLLKKPKNEKLGNLSILEEDFPSFSLSKNFTQNCKDYFVRNFNKNEIIYVFCGSGEKSNSGLSLARLLYLEGFYVEVYIEKHPQLKNKELKIIYNSLKEIGISVLKYEEDVQDEIKEASIIIDAITDSNDERYCKIIEQLNESNAIKISLDKPSGLIDDSFIDFTTKVFKADITLTSSLGKKIFFHPETSLFCGKVISMNSIPVDEFTKSTESNDYIINEEAILEVYRLRNKFSHKGDFGKVSLVVGSYGMVGAAVLSVKAALRTGVGITTVQSPRCGYNILQTTCPEAIFISTGEEETQNIHCLHDSFFGIGSGLGTKLETKQAFFELLQNVNSPMVIDADGLNILSEHPEYFSYLPKNSILTPHPSEFERLFGTTENSFEMQSLAKTKAKELQCYIVLKGHHTQVVCPNGEVYYNTTGNAGLAKGGSGDVLLGIVSGLLAQGYSSLEASILGVWLHGKAADITAEKHSKESMLASDVIDHLGEVFKILEIKKGKD